MNDRLPVLFADAGETCAEEDRLNEAFAELVRRVPTERLAEALCYARADRWGLCPHCGHAFVSRGDGHQPGCPSPFKALWYASRAVRAYWRYGLWCLRRLTDRKGQR